MPVTYPAPQRPMTRIERRRIREGGRNATTFFFGGVLFLLVLAAIA